MAKQKVVLSGLTIGILLSLSASADINALNQRVESLMKDLPGRKCQTGKGMPTKLGLLYLMGKTESLGMIELGYSGYVPIVKTGSHSADRAWRVCEHNHKAIWVLSGGGPLKWKEETPQEAAERRHSESVETLMKVPEAWRTRVDYLELTPCMWEPKSASQALWYSEFLCELLPRIADLGPRPIVLNSGVGGLPDRASVLDAMAPGLRLAKHLGGAWGCHGYTLKYTMDESHELWYSLRYRRAYAHFKIHHPDLVDLPMILLEGGVDDRGDPDKDGWLARGSLPDYTTWLAWYDEQLKRDDQVLGVTLFKIGAPGTWKSFELEPVVPWFFEYWGKAYGKGPKRVRGPNATADYPAENERVRLPDHRIEFGLPKGWAVADAGRDATAEWCILQERAGSGTKATICLWVGSELIKAAPADRDLNAGTTVTAAMWAAKEARSRALGMTREDTPPSRAVEFGMGYKYEHAAFTRVQLPGRKVSGVALCSEDLGGEAVTAACASVPDSLSEVTRLLESIVTAVSQ